MCMYMFMYMYMYMMKHYALYLRHNDYAVQKSYS